MSRRIGVRRRRPIAPRSPRSSAGVLDNVFMQLYQNDIIDEDSFLAWEEDTSDATPGKEKVRQCGAHAACAQSAAPRAKLATALMRRIPSQLLHHTAKFFDWLKEADEDDEDDEDEVAKALKGVVKPNNNNKLR